VRARAALTNTTPTAPFRGAGRPEAIYAIERLLDIAASRLGIDRVAIRRRNIVQTAQLPYRSAVGLTYDSGDFSANMDRALRLADWDGVHARRSDAAARGKLRGAGFANYVEAPVGAVRERATVHVHPSGRVDIVAGTQSTGQGHETVYAQVVADLLDVPIDCVHLIAGDTDAVTLGGGTHSNRSMRIVGTLLVQLCAELRERAASLGARNVIEAAQRAAEPLTATADFAGRIAAHPTGCAACEVEIDPATGQITVERYAQVDDCGQPINPLILDGQTHGGIAMGIGQALMEIQTVDGEAGVQGGSFMTYALPRATDVPHLDVAFAEHPTAGNPLRVKGGGEGGVTPAPAVIVNAICDALRDFGVEHIDTPVTPERVWLALRDAARVPELAGRT
jgi:carbon-monoxide dehydrogenase large subunit